LEATSIGLNLIYAAYETNKCGISLSESEFDVIVSGDGAIKCFMPSLMPSANILETEHVGADREHLTALEVL
jgi:hypothetical protein